MNQCCLHFSWFIKENHSGGSHFRFTKCEKWLIDDSLQRSLGGMSFIFYSVQKILRKESFWIHENSRALGDWLFFLVNTDKNVSSCKNDSLCVCLVGVCECASSTLFLSWRNFESHLIHYFSAQSYAYRVYFDSVVNVQLFIFFSNLTVHEP